MLGRLYNELEGLVHDIEEEETVVMVVASFKRQSDADTPLCLVGKVLCTPIRSNFPKGTKHKPKL